MICLLVDLTYSFWTQRCIVCLFCLRANVFTPLAFDRMLRKFCPYVINKNRDYLYSMCGNKEPVWLLDRHVCFFRDPSRLPGI